MKYEDLITKVKNSGSSRDFIELLEKVSNMVADVRYDIDVDPAIGQEVRRGIVEILDQLVISKIQQKQEKPVEKLGDEHYR